MAAKRYIAEYARTQCYGGPEEGGWWYNVTEFAGYQYCGSNKKAKEQLELQSEDLEPGYHLRIETLKTMGCKDTTNKPRPYYE